MRLHQRLSGWGIDKIRTEDENEIAAGDDGALGGLFEGSDGEHQDEVQNDVAVSDLWQVCWDLIKKTAGDCTNGLALSVMSVPGVDIV